MGQYKTDGKTIQFTDADTFRLATDLYQYVEHDYKGSDSVDAVRLEDIVKNLQAGKPLQAGEWDMLRDIKQRAGQGFEQWKARGRDGQGAEVPAGSGRVTEAAATFPHLPAQMREQYAVPSTTPKDKATTAPHLLDSVLHDLAHSRQHIRRLLDPDVKASAQSVAFNAEHALNHAESAQEHAKKLDKHLAANVSDPKSWTGERTVLNAMREAKAPPPPNLRRASPGGNRCGTCEMFWAGSCWGFSNIHVEREWVCDEWALDDTRTMSEAAPGASPTPTAEDTIVSRRSREPTITVDFDGVIHQGPHGLPGAVSGEVVKGAPEGLKNLAERFRVVVLTARIDLDAVRDWLQKQGLAKYINEVTNVKPPASAYIDDRATHFTDWPSALKAVDPDVPVIEVPKTTGKAYKPDLKEAASDPVKLGLIGSLLKGAV